MTIMKAALVTATLLLAAQGAFAEESSLMQDKLLTKNQQAILMQKEKAEASATASVKQADPQKKNC